MGVTAEHVVRSGLWRVTDSTDQRSRGIVHDSVCLDDSGYVDLAVLAFNEPPDGPVGVDAEGNALGEPLFPDELDLDSLQAASAFAHGSSSGPTNATVEGFGAQLHGDAFDGTDNRMTADIVLWNGFGVSQDGDSGMLWVLEDSQRPLGVHWGGSPERYSLGARSRFGFATAAWRLHDLFGVSW